MTDTHFRNHLPVQVTNENVNQIKYMYVDEIIIKNNYNNDCVVKYY